MLSIPRRYPFYDQGGNDGNGDFQMNVRDTQPQVNKQLNFLLPFMGFGFNYTWLSLHGYACTTPSQHDSPKKLIFPLPATWHSARSPSSFPNIPCSFRSRSGRTWMIPHSWVSHTSYLQHD